LKNDEAVKVFYSNDGWHQIQYNNGLGWISDQNVELIMPVDDIKKIPDVEGETNEPGFILFP
jgi:hypothetical protein